MTQHTRSVTCLVRPTAILSFLVLLVCSHRACQSFQQSPLFLTTRSSVLTPSTSTYSSLPHFYADPTSNIHDQTPPPPSFEQRMREQLRRRQSSSSSPSSTSPSSQKKTTEEHQLVSDVRDLNEYKEALDKAGEDNKMLAVLWYSPWCKACRAVKPGIRTIAKRHPDVRFIQVPVLAENANLHQGLDVPSVPYLHLYATEDPRLVEEQRMTRKKLSGFQKLLCDYERGHCSLEQMEGDDENNSNGVWSTSNPYSVASTSFALTSTPNTNSPETRKVGRVGATATP